MTEKKPVRGCHITAAQKEELTRRIKAGEIPAHAAKALGVGKRSAWRIARGMKKDAPSSSSVSQKLGGSVEDREFIALKDETSRLRRELVSAHRNSLNEEAIKKLLGRMAAAPSSPPDWLIAEPKQDKKQGTKTAEVPVVIWSDWHMGEVVSLAETNGVNEYNPDIAEERIKRLVTSTIQLCRKHGPGTYPGIVVNLLGDFVSGGLHPELLRTDAEEQIPSALRCRDLLVEALETMQKEFGRIYAPCASGNHGRNTIKPELKRYVYKNFDYLIYELLARHFEGNKDIIIDNRSSNEVYYRVYNQRYLAMHGDMLGVKGGDGIIGSIGPIMRGEIKTRGQATSTGRDYDTLLIGHWHQPLWLPRAIVANTLKGFDEYAKNALRAPPTEPSQPLWFVHPRRGITSRWDVKVDEPKAKKETQWVSWENEA